MASSALVEVIADLDHQGLHRLAAMVAGHIGMEVLPEAFTLVVLGAVGRPEVQFDRVP
jgi:hypothetical protein